MSASAVNQRFVLAKHPKTLPDDSTYTLESVPVPTAVKDGDVVLRSLYISVDPYLRGAMASLPVGAPVVSGQIAEVVESKNPAYKQGDKVQRYGDWARYQLVNPPAAGSPEAANPFVQLNKVQALADDIPLSAYLGVLGMPGATAFFGLKEAAGFKKGDVVLVSGAAGAVGSLVGQLAKLWGAKLVIGSAGGPEKTKLVTEKYGFDACIDYKLFDTQEKVVAELKRLAPQGVDLYYDNTGGHVSDAFYDVVRKHARVAVCGQIASYNAGKVVDVPSPFGKIIYTSVRIQGFVVFDYAARWAEFLKEVTPLVKDKKVKFEETVVEGFEKLPEAFLGLFKGANVGKMIVKV